MGPKQKLPDPSIPKLLEQTQIQSLISGKVWPWITLQIHRHGTQTTKRDEVRTLTRVGISLHKLCSLRWAKPMCLNFKILWVGPVPNRNKCWLQGEMVPSQLPISQLSPIQEPRRFLEVVFSGQTDRCLTLSAGGMGRHCAHGMSLFHRGPRWPIPKGTKWPIFRLIHKVYIYIYIYIYMYTHTITYIFKYIYIHIYIWFWFFSFIFFFSFLFPSFLSLLT